MRWSGTLNCELAKRKLVSYIRLLVLSHDIQYTSNGFGRLERSCAALLPSSRGRLAMAHSSRARRPCRSRTRRDRLRKINRALHHEVSVFCTSSISDTFPHRGLRRFPLFRRPSLTQRPRIFVRRHALPPFGGVSLWFPVNACFHGSSSPHLQNRRS